MIIDHDDDDDDDPPAHWPRPENRSLYSQSLQLDPPLNIPLCRSPQKPPTQLTNLSVSRQPPTFDILCK